jgi:hypothetical protein
MCNCNQKRTAYTSAKSSAGDAVTGMIQVRLVQKKALVVTGDITGRVYEFNNKNDINWVDKRDLPNIAELKGLVVLH